MFWNCFSANGTGRLVRIEGIMKQDQYVKILRENLEKSVETLNTGSGMIFQHDNDPKHTAKSVKENLRDNRINVLDSPRKSPDRNSIENLWVLVKKKFNTKKPKNFVGLEEIVRVVQYFC